LIVIIIGIMISFAVPSMFAAKKKAHDKTAISQLALILDAEKMVRLEQNEYKDCADTLDCNSVLGLDLSPIGYWNYSIAVDNSVSPARLCAQAVSKDGARYWHIQQDSLKATEGACP
ncbi:MAG: hypothetical protein KKH25_04225, partial [Candidatus Omnitrophica bacterium]|nr:hypothetical protein [Candidatus Omnitrophota bacterium]